MEIGRCVNSHLSRSVESFTNTHSGLGDWCQEHGLLTGLLSAIQHLQYWQNFLGWDFQ